MNKYTIITQKGKEIKGVIFTKQTQSYKIYRKDQVLFYTTLSNKITESYKIVEVNQNLAKAMADLDRIRETKLKSFSFKYVGKTEIMEDAEIVIQAVTHSEAWKKLIDTYSWLSKKTQHYKMLGAQINEFVVGNC